MTDLTVITQVGRDRATGQESIDLLDATGKRQQSMAACIRNLSVGELFTRSEEVRALAEVDNVKKRLQNVVRSTATRASKETGNVYEVTVLSNVAFDTSVVVSVVVKRCR